MNTNFPSKADEQTDRTWSVYEESRGSSLWVKRTKPKRTPQWVSRILWTAGPTHLREVEESWLTEQDVSQEHRAARQHFNLVFTEMMAPQEFTKVPGNERTSGRWMQPLEKMSRRRSWQRTPVALQSLCQNITAGELPPLDYRQTETHCCSKMLKTTDCAMTKQFGSTMPSSPHILATQEEDIIALEMII